MLIAIGFFLIIGIAGSADLNTLNIMETVIYAFIGIVIMLIGFAKEVYQS